MFKAFACTVAFAFLLGTAYAAHNDEFYGLQRFKDISPDFFSKMEAQENEAKEKFGINFSVLKDQEEDEPLKLPKRRTARVLRTLKRIERKYQDLHDPEKTENMPNEQRISFVQTMKHALEDVSELTEEKHPEVLRWVGRVLCNFAMTEEDVFKGLVSFHKSLKAKKSATTFLDAGNCLWRGGRSLEAIELFEEAAKLEGTAENWHYVCTSTMHRLGPIKALDCFKGASEALPKETPIKLNYGAGLVHLGQFAEGVPVLKEVLEDDDTMLEGHLTLARAYMHLGKAEEAVWSMRKAASLASENANIVNELGLALRLANHEADAQAQIQLAVQLGKYPKPAQRPPRYFSDLTARPWHNTRKFKFLAVLEDAAEEMAKEFSGHTDWAVEDTSPLSRPRACWKPTLLRFKGDWLQRHCEKIQKTCDIISAIEELQGAAANVYIARLEPNCHLMPTVGETNALLRADLPLGSGKGLQLRVGEETKNLEAHKGVVFDASFEHEVWNQDSESLVLTVEFWHPELTGEDKAEKRKEVAEKLK